MAWFGIIPLLLFLLETNQAPSNKNVDLHHNDSIVQVPRIDLSQDVLREEFSGPYFTGRQKRFSPLHYEKKQKTLKIMVVVDDSVVNFHGNKNVELYVHSMLSVVDQAFHHPSLGNEVNVIPVKIHHMNSTGFKKIWSVKKAADILRKFCEWTSETKKSLYKDDMIDANVYLTRENFGPAGYAPVHGVCHDMRNCALVRDSGLSSAFVFAHEIGHNLGINHDGDENKCEANVNDGRIMGPRVFSHFFSYRWSSCSREYLDKYLPYATCLNMAPEDPPIIRYSDTYGQNWSLDEQCRQEFGHDFAFCPHNAFMLQEQQIYGILHDEK